MSRGLTEPTQPEAEDGPSLKDLDDAMREAYQNIYDLSVRVETLENILANLIAPEAKNE